MPRPAKHAHAQILDAAAAIVSRQGPNAATVNAIAHAIGAPNGSIYHRFRTRDELLGRLWLRTAARFQDAFAEELKRPDAMQAGLHAALSIARVARLDAEAAGIMLLYRREDFLSGAWSRELTAEAERLGAQAKDGLDGLTRRLFGKLNTAHRQVTSFATLDVPYAAVRRFVGKGEPPPPLVDRLITNAYGAVMAEERPRGRADG
jgi:AcrR family transcriptional regulator